jgi:hypothetical protein
MLHSAVIILLQFDQFPTFSAHFPEMKLLELKVCILASVASILASTYGTPIPSHLESIFESEEELSTPDSTSIQGSTLH